MVSYRIHKLLSISLVLVIISSTVDIVSSSNTSLVNDSVPDSVSRYSGKPLNVLDGKKVYMIKLGSKTNAYHERVLLEHENILYNIVTRINGEAKSFDKILGRLLTSIEKYDKNINIWYTYKKYENAEYVSTDIGYFHYKYRDGRVHAMHHLGKQFASELENLITTIPPFTVLNTTVVYGYYGGEKTRCIERIVMSRVAEGKDVPLKTVTEVEYVNPCEKYYILIDDIRIGFPLKIGVQETAYGPQVMYVDGFIPRTLEENVKEFRIDKNYLDKILDIYVRETGFKTADTGKLLIADIYYTVSPDNQYLVPLLQIYMNNTNKLVSIFLYPDKPVLGNTATLASDTVPRPSDPVNNLYQYIINSLNNTTGNKEQYSNIIWAGSIIVPIILITTLYYILKKKHK